MTAAPEGGGKVMRLCGILLAVLLLAGCAATQPKETPVGSQVSGIFEVGGKQVPLPPGTWIVTGSRTFFNNFDVRFSRSALSQIKSNTLENFIYLFTNEESGFGFGYDGFVTYKPCERTNLLFVKVFSNDSGGFGGKQDCWYINHVIFKRHLAGKNKVLQQSFRYFLDNKINLPHTIIKVNFRLATDVDVITVGYYFNPESEGHEVPTTGLKWSDNPWYRTYIVTDAEKEAYIEKLKNWGRSWREKVRLGFQNKL